jgi:hypothetical protein
VRDGKFAYRSYVCSRTAKSGEEKALKGVPIVGFHDKEQRMLGVRSISPDQFQSFDIRIKEGVRATFVNRTGLGRVALGNVK